MKILSKIKRLLIDLSRGTTREYEVIEGILCVRSFGQDWQPLEEHLEKEHPEEYKTIREGLPKGVKDD